MQYHISKLGKVVGTFDLDQVIAGVQDGTFVDTDHYWCQGMAAWETIAQFRAKNMPASPPPPPAPAPVPAPAPASRPAPAPQPRPVAQPRPAVQPRPVARPAAAPAAATPAAAPAAVGAFNVVGMIGGGALILSTITPFIHVAIVSATLMKFSEVRAWIFIGIGGLALYLASSKLYAALRIVAMVSLAAAIELAVEVGGRLSRMNTPRRSGGEDSLAEGISEMMRASISAEIGAILLVAGVLCLLYAGFKGAQQQG